MLKQLRGENVKEKQLKILKIDMLKQLRGENVKDLQVRVLKSS